MIANLENIQIVYNEIPNTWIADGVQTDNYKKSEEHYLHGWREVVIPTITHLQRLGSEYILVNDIVTKEVIDFTDEEIEAYNRSLIPSEISRMRFKMQIRRSTYYTYEIIVAYIENMAVSEIFNEDMKQDILYRLHDCVKFERYSPDFIMLANMLNVSDEIKDEIFIEGNKIQ